MELDLPERFICDFEERLEFCRFGCFGVDEQPGKCLVYREANVGGSGLEFFVVGFLQFEKTD